MQTLPDIRDMFPEPVFEFRMRIQVGPIREDGVRGDYRIRHIPILGGTVEGVRLRGQIETGGADHQSIRTRDGLALIDAQYRIHLEDGTVVGIRNMGVRHGPAAVMARLAAGELVDPHAYYFRTTPVFEAPEGPHDWLTQAVFVGVGARAPDGVLIDVYRLT